jgi:hypothetical protein
VLACAVAAKAGLVVSGDPHLLKLVQYEGIPIVAPPFDSPVDRARLWPGVLRTSWPDDDAADAFIAL